MTTSARRILVPLIILLMAGGFYVFMDREKPVSQSLPPPAVPSHARPLPYAPLGLKDLTDVALPWQARVDMLRRVLQSQCGEQEFAYLYALLERGAEPNERAESWYVIANDIMEQLSRRDPDESRFSTRMLAYLNNARQPLVLRDYAVQHLGTWINPGVQPPLAQLANSSPTINPMVRSRAIHAAVLKGIAAAAVDPALQDSSIPGTVCMMLVALARSNLDGTDYHAALTTLKPWLAHALADGSQLSTPLKVSAVQAAALSPVEFRPMLRAIAYREGGQESLRLPAIATLARCGDASDLEMLQKINNTGLVAAAEDARRVLSSRLSASNSTQPKVISTPR